MNDRQLVHLRAKTGHPRTTHGELVVPVVALLGDHVLQAINATGPEFVPLSTLAAAPHEWNGKPVVLGHPTQNGRQISANSARILDERGLGRIANARIERGRLCADLHIDEARARHLAPDLLMRLRAGEPVEVSVGAFVGTVAQSGTHNGKTYQAVWTTVTPDHLAFVPRGACSCSDGCGTYQRAAELHREDDMFTPRNPYEHAAQQLRARVSSPESRAEDDYRAARLRELACEYEQIDLDGPLPSDSGLLARLIAAAEHIPDPPNPWAAGIRELQEGSLR
jgi:hypothetical protein